MLPSRFKSRFFFLEEDTLVLLKEISFSDQVKRTNGLWQEARVCSKRLSHMHIGQTQSKKYENEWIPKWQLCKDSLQDTITDLAA